MVSLENILAQPFSASFEAYTSPLLPFPELFFGVFFVAIPVVVVGLKTQHVVPPLMVFILSSLLVSPFVGQFAWHFRIAAGVCFGLLFYMMYEGSGRR